MVKVTVKTLTSSCHEFDLEDGSTVAQLKALIQEKVSIDPARQRLIFLGKVLQNDRLLSEYNVDGKVIHLVESQVPRSRGDGAESSTAAASAPAADTTHTDTLHQATINITNTTGAGPEQIGQQMIEQILNSLGVDAGQAQIHRTAVGDGQALQMSIAIPHRDDQFQVHIVNETAGTRRSSLPSNTASTGTSTSTSSTTSTTTSTNPTPPTTAAPAAATTGATGGATGGASHATGAPGTAGGPTRARGRGAPGLDSILNNLRAVRESMRHIPCTANPDLINNVLQAPCIRAPYTRGPALGEDGATQEQVDQRATSRESLETYSHILVDLADIQLEMVRYMNQYARLLHHDPPLDGPGLAHAENLASRMATSFHSLAHAYHLLSDFGISFSQPPPRRLWMAQLTGASMVVQNTQNNVRHQINIVRGPSPAARPATAPAAPRPARPASAGPPTAAPAPGAAPGPTRARGRGIARPRPTPTTVPGAAVPGAAPTRPPPGIPAGIPGMPNMQTMLANIAAQGAGAPGVAGAMHGMRPSLPCNSRHRLYQQRCSAENCTQRSGPRPPAAGHTHGHGHSHGHSHTGHGHSHTHATANGGFPPAPHAPHVPAADISAQLGNLATVVDAVNASLPNTEAEMEVGVQDSNSGASLGSFMASSPAQVQALHNFLLNVLLNPQAQSQPIATHWSHIRALLEVLMPDSTFTCTENSQIGAFFSIIGHQFNITQLTEFSRGNNELFDQVYQPLRAHYLSSLFDNASPSQQQVDAAVDNILRDERDMIVQLHDSSNGNSELDQDETVLRIFGELFRTIIRDLMRRDNPSGFGETFSSAVQRSLALYMAFARRNNEGRSGLDQQIMTILESQAFIQNLPAVSDEEVERYLVRARPEEEEEEDQMSADEYVDAEENGFHKEEDEDEEERKRRESLTYLLDDDNFMDDSSEESKVVNNDELDDLELEPVPRPSVTNSVPPARPSVPNARPTVPSPRGRGAAVSAADLAPVPEEWKDVIQGDVEKLRTASYPPLSDAYIDWIPAKRRRVVNKTKRSTNPEQVLGELVQRSVPTGSNIKTEEHPEVESLFRSQLREDLAKRLRDNDLDENRYPAAAKIKKSNT